MTVARATLRASLRPACDTALAPLGAALRVLAASVALLGGLTWSAGAQANDIVRGAEVYRQHCMQCHGPDGVSTWPGAPSFARREGLMQPDMMLLERIRSGGKAMPAYRGMLNDRDILSVIAYLRTMMR